MTRICLLVCLTISLWPASVSAQPLLQREHDWTFETGQGTYGLVQYGQANGQFPMTVIYMGSHSFSVSFRVVEVGAFVFLPLAALAGVLLYRHYRKLPPDSH